MKAEPEQSQHRCDVEEQCWEVGATYWLVVGRKRNKVDYGPEDVGKPENFSDAEDAPDNGEHQDTLLHRVTVVILSHILI